MLFKSFSRNVRVLVIKSMNDFFGWNSGMRMRGLAVQMQELGLSIICYGNSRHQVVMYMMYNCNVTNKFRAYNYDNSYSVDVDMSGV